MGHHISLLVLSILISLSKPCTSWGWFPFSSNIQNSKKPVETWASNSDIAAEFSLEALDDRKGAQLLKNARRKMAGLNSCWQSAYQQIFAACSEIIGDDSEKRKRFAWDLSNCFEKDSGKPSFPHCHTSSPMQKCLGKLDDSSRHTYLQFFLETNSICYQLQAAAFRQQTERLVNDLKKSADYTEDKLVSIEKKSDHLLQSSNNILESLTSIDQQAQQVAKTSKNVLDHIGVVVEHSEAVTKQTKKIAASQSELQKAQAVMNDNLEEGMEILHESYNNLGQRMDTLKNETVEVEKKINKVGNTMSKKMINLQSKANDIGNMTGVSLDKQKQLLEKQSKALEGLQSLTDFQSQALSESRDTLKELAEFGHKQQEMLLRRQEQLERAHDNLVENSKSILAAQETFEVKQANMFAALDKLFTLHKAMLLESRLIKTFFVYCIAIFVLYMLTSTKQTYTVRPSLYMGLCASFMIEFAILRFMTNDIKQQTWIINLVRLLFVLLASIHLLYAMYAYRDYELLNYQMLLTLIQKVNSMHKIAELSCDNDSDVDWSSWVDTELLDDVDNLKDPDYMLPEPEEVGENDIATSSITRKYNLRHHC